MKILPAIEPTDPLGLSFTHPRPRPVGGARREEAKPSH